MKLQTTKPSEILVDFTNLYDTPEDRSLNIPKYEDYKSHEMHWDDIYVCSSDLMRNRINDILICKTEEERRTELEHLCTFACTCFASNDVCKNWQMFMKSFLSISHLTQFYSKRNPSQEIIYTQKYMRPGVRNSSSHMKKVLHVVCRSTNIFSVRL
jgi:hypothetical protein